MKSHLQLILYPNIEKKMGVTEHSEELLPFEKEYIFGLFLNLRARAFLSLTCAHGVILSQIRLKICNFTKQSTRISINAKKNENLSILSAARVDDAHSRKILKCLK